jgi:uncharacterized protein (TIGR00369 family)
MSDFDVVIDTTDCRCAEWTSSPAPDRHKPRRDATMSDDVQRDLEHINVSSLFNRWAAFSVDEAIVGRCVLSIPWRPEFGQYSGFLHAGVIAALLDTSCGFAAATKLGALMTSQMSISFLAPAVGERFRSEATLVRGGKRQAFAEARLIASRNGEDKLVATATAVLLRVPEAQPSLVNSAEV